MLLKTDLNADWHIHGCEPGGLDPKDVCRRDYDTSAWLPAAVPGDVNAVLVDAGCMPDPHVGDQARQCYWVTAKEWWYRRTFVADASWTCADLYADGVDGHADVYLNGTHVGRLENAFHPHRMDVSNGLLREAENVLAIRFESIDQVLGGPRDDELAGWKGRRCLMRKAQYAFGWDWALPLPSIGMGGCVRLEQYVGPRLKSVSIDAKLCGRIDFKFEVNRAAKAAGYDLEVAVSGHGQSGNAAIEGLSSCFSYTSVHLDKPRWWWPAGFGDQPLYEYCVRLKSGGQIVEEHAGHAAFREASILEEPFSDDPSAGISFWICINGQGIFCKGANWIPTELWPALGTDEQVDFYLRKAREAHFNMLRVWGGGIYERKRFYDLCDRLGIMVWQDFMFASTGYPVDLLRDRIIREAEYQIRRLREHPSVVIWCGCNEDVFSWGLPKARDVDCSMADTGGYAEAGGALNIDRLRDDPRIYSMILRGLVDRDGLGVPYVESSPLSYDDAGNDPCSGNSHVSSWKYALFECADRPARFREHFDKTLSFNSEFCIQGPCSVATFESFMPGEHRWPPDDVWTFHIQRGHRNLPHHEQTLFIADDCFGTVRDLESYVKHGQATHVEMMRGEFEAARRDRPDCGGTMVWMFNDCWPTSNWSIIDYRRRPKPAYYAARRACAPVLPMIVGKQEHIRFCLSNDSAQAVRADLTFGLAHLDGSAIWQQSRRLAVDSMATACFHTLPVQELRAVNGDYLWISSSVDGVRLPVTTYFPLGWRDITWPSPTVTVDLLPRKEKADGVHSVLRVTTDAFVRFCHLSLDGLDGRHWFSDNFFDLPAGMAHRIEVLSEKPFRADELSVGHWLTPWR